MAAMPTDDELLKRITAVGGPYELQEQCLSGVNMLVYRRAPRTLKNILARGERMGDATLAYHNGQFLSFRKAFDDARLIQRSLEQYVDHPRGARVALAIREPFRWIATFIALVTAGSTAVLLREPFDRFLRTAPIDALISDSFVPTSEAGLVVIPHHVLLNGPPPTKPIAHDRGVSAEPYEPSESTDAIVAFTSGTTGPPKAIVLTNLNIISGLFNIAIGGLLVATKAPASKAARKLNAPMPPCTLLLSPISHVSGYLQLLMAFLTGAKLVIAATWEPQSILALIEANSITNLAGISSAQLRQLLDHSQHPPRSLKTIGLNATPIGRQLIDRLLTQWPEVRLLTAYGLTETAGPVSVCRVDSQSNDSPLDSKILPVVELRICRGSDVVPDGEVGEIFLRGACVATRCYVCGKRAQLLRDGWFPTGDLGVLLPNRMLRLLDRAAIAKYLDRTPVFPRQLELALLNEPGILDAGILFDDTKGTLVAFVVITGERHVRVKELRRKLSDLSSLPSDNVYVQIVPSLPRDQFGTLNDFDLRNMSV